MFENHIKGRDTEMNKTAAVQRQQAKVTENGVMERNEVLGIYQPKTNFKGGSIKWYEDKPRKSVTH